MRKKAKENYLDKKPKRAEHIGWSKDDDGIVTLEIENKGIFNCLAQKLLKKPQISYIHLDKMGSFIWPFLDGGINVYEIGKKVKEKYKDDAEPLYERLIKYLQILHSYGFILWNKE